MDDDSFPLARPKNAPMSPLPTMKSIAVTRLRIRIGDNIDAYERERERENLIASIKTNDAHLP